MPLYRDFATQAELDLQYDPERWVGDQTAFDRVIAGRAELVARARGAVTPIEDIAYGPTRWERLDIYPAAAPNAPILIYIHGGYWFDARLVKGGYNWIGAAFARAGVTTVVIDYAVCPAVTIDEISRQCRAAVAFVYRNGRRYGGDTDRIYVCGSSAGGHLTGMVATTDWVGDYDLAAGVVKGGCPISGLFDLRPFPYTWLQPKLQLDWAQVRRNSPLGLVRPGLPPLLVVFGADESPEFHRQSADFVAALQGAGSQAALMRRPGCNHWTVLTDLAQPESSFFRAMHAHMHACWTQSASLR